MPRVETQTSSAVKVLSLGFGFGSWIAITGLWVELPLLVQQLPENARLASHLTVVIQVANISTLLYWLVRRMKWCSEVTAIHAQMVIGTLACIALMTAWNYTPVIYGEPRSVALFAATLSLALVDCVSSVTFLPFMSRFKSQYLTPYLIGEGFSGLVPTVAAFVQGVEETPCGNITTVIANNSDVPRFSVEAFFSSLLVTMLISWLSFALLLYLPLAKGQQVDREELLSCTPKAEVILLNEVPTADGMEVAATLPPSNSGRFSRRRVVWLHIAMCWSCMTTFGLMPPIQPYATLPYGASTLHYTVTLGAVAYPVGCAVAIFVNCRSVKGLTALMLAGTLLCVYIFSCSIFNDAPLFQHRAAAAVIICCWTLFTLILSYVKTMITAMLNDDGGNEALFVVGLSTQFGSLLGAGFMFVLVNWTNLYPMQC